MAKFTFTARDASGTALNGEMVAQSSADAVRKLRSEGKFVVKLEEFTSTVAAAVPTVKIGGSRVKVDETVYFANQLASMIDTGVPVSEALEATIDNAPPGPFRRTVEDLIQRVQSGQDFSSALAAHPKVFGRLFVHMVRASEASGTLGPMLTRVADYMVSQREIKKKIRGALAYPICMLLFAVGVTIFLMTYVLPQFTAIYKGKQAVLPTATRVLMGISDGLVDHWTLLLGGAVAIAVGLTLFFRSSRGGYTGDWLRLNLPLIGPMFRKACLARSLRTLGTMIASGVSVLEAVQITRDVVGNRPFARTFDRLRDRLERGEQLSQALLDADYFPRPVWQMLNAGERTGQLAPAMIRVADFCEADMNHAIRSVTQFIEPATIVVMGLIVGGIALAMLMPIFQISKVMAQ